MADTSDDWVDIDSVAPASNDVGSPSGPAYDPSTAASAPPIPAGGIPQYRGNGRPSGTTIDISRQTRTSPKGAGSGQGPAAGLGDGSGFIPDTPSAHEQVAQKVPSAGDDQGLLGPSSPGISDDQDVLGPSDDHGLLGPASPTTGHEEWVPLPGGTAGNNDGWADAEGLLGPSVPPPEKPKGPLSNSPTDTDVTGMAKNAATGIIKGAGWVGGMGGDLRHMFARGLAGLESLVSDKTTDQLYNQYLRGEADVGKALRGAPIPLAGRALMPPTSEDVTAPVLRRTGEYEPTTEAGKLGQIGVAGATAALSPGGWRAALQRLGQGDVALALRTAQQALQPSITGAATAVGSAEAEKNLGPVGGILAGLGLPFLAHAVPAVAERTFGPQGPRAQRGQAGRQLLDVAQDPAKLTQAAGESAVPGTKPTLADVTGDPGVARAEAVAEKVGPDKFKAQIQGQRTANKEAQGALIQSLGDPEADPHIVSKALQDHVGEMTSQYDNLLTQLEAKVREKSAAAPQGMAPDQLSQQTQAAAYKAGQQMRAELERLREAIDPTGEMGIHPAVARETAQKMRAAYTPTRPDAATPYLERAASWGDRIPFNDMWQFDNELSGAIEQASRSGDTFGAQRLRELKRAVKENINTTLDDTNQWEKAAVQRGELDPNDTTAARLERERAEWYAARAAREGVGASTGANAGPRSSGVSGVSGGQSASNARSGLSPGDHGIPGDAAGLGPFDAEAAERFNDWKRRYGIYKETFKRGPVGEALKRAPFGDKFADPLAGLNAVVPGPKGALHVQAWMKAIPDGAPLLRTQAAQALRQALGPDGLVTPAKLDAWKKRYADALRAIDEVSPGFSKSFDDAAKATEALGEAAKLRKRYVDQLTEGKLSRLMGAQSPEEVRRIVGGMLRSPESTGQFKTLLARLKGDPEAIEGVRRAAADWITTNLVTNARDSHGEPMLSGAKFDRLLRERPDTLKLLFGPEGVKVLQDIGKESARAERTATMKRTAVGSDTASYLEPIYRSTEQAREQGTGLEGGLTIGALLEGMRGGLKEAAMLYGSRVVLGQLRKYTSAWRARGLERVQDIYHEALLDPDFARQLAKEAITTESGKKISALHWLRRTSIALEANREAQNQFRQGHADGGAVKFDPEAHGAQMVKLVSKIRNDLNSRTKPLLGVHDDVIAAALAIAREASA